MRAMSKVTIHQGHVLSILRSLPDESVHCCITSPPYWGLRKYLPKGDPLEKYEIGLEPTIEEYVGKMVEIFREVRRVLHRSGVVFLNLGDSYYGGGGAHKESHANPGISNSAKRGGVPKGRDDRGPNRQYQPGLKPKDLCGVPWRVALALQADGWWLRSDIIWAKRNCMPESVEDRPTKSHEYIFLLTKSQHYFWDQGAVREEAQNWGTRDRKGKAFTDGVMPSGQPHRGCKNGNFREQGRNLRTVWEMATAPFSGVASYGTCRIESPDCPVHDYQESLLCALEYDELPIVSQIAHNLDTGNYLYPRHEGAAVSIPIDRPGFLLGGFSAMCHNIQIHKKDGQLVQGEIFSGISVDHIEYKELIDHSVAKFFRKSGSRTSEGASQGEPCSDLSEQIPSHILGILTYESPPPGCLCHYTGKVEKKQDHFAVFPPALPERCIKAGSSERGCCPQCLAPWQKVVEKKGGTTGKSWHNHENDLVRGMRGGDDGHNIAADLYKTYSVTTLGWRPGCKCDAGEPIPATVLDIFGGAMTTALVAAKLGRSSISIELSPAYVKMGVKRLKKELGMLIELIIKEE